MIVHRIINPNNIMLIWDTQPVIKLIDFSQTVQKDCPKPFTVLLHKQNVIFILNSLSTIFNIFAPSNSLKLIYVIVD